MKFKLITWKDNLWHFYVIRVFLFQACVLFFAVDMEYMLVVSVIALMDGRAENVKLLKQNVLIQAVMVMEDVEKVFASALLDGQEKVAK